MSVVWGGLHVDWSELNMNAGVSRSHVKGIYWANSFVDSSCIFCLNFTLSNYESVCVCVCRLDKRFSFG